jgi:hypothetical protein
MDKIDLRKTFKTLYQPSAKAVAEVDVPAFDYLMIDGAGDPNTTPAYVQAVEALFAVSYAAKFALKKGPQQIDYAVMPLEGLWWADDMAAFARGDRSLWQWTMMIVQLPCVPRDVVDQAIADVRRKKPSPALARLRQERWAEGRCAQILHVGPFTEEGPTIARLHAWIAAHGKLRGKHHEIYLSDVRRADPAQWKTVLRQPVA